MRGYLFSTKIAFTFLVCLMFLALSSGSALWDNLTSKALEYPNKTLPKFAYLDQKIALMEEDATNQVLGLDEETLEYSLSVPVIYYHGITEKYEPDQVTWDNFYAQMKLLKQNGYETVSLDQFRSFLLGQTTLPDKSFLLTFDDGRKDSYYPVDPVLEKFGYEGVMFLITSSLDEESTYHLSSQEVSKMLKTGRWEIGSHSHSGHKRVPVNESGEEQEYLAYKIWLSEEGRLETSSEYEARVKNDLLESKRVLKEKFDVDATVFAFPFGAFGQNDTNYDQAEKVYTNISKSLFEMSFYQPWDEHIKVNYPTIDTSMIKRIEVEDDWSAEDLLAEVSNNKDKQLPYEDDLSEDNGWRDWWGNVSFVSGQMSLYGDENSTGAGVFLKGAKLWTDYRYNAEISSFEGNTFSLLTRAKSGNDYVYCTFSKDSMRLRQKYDGQIVEKSEIKRDFSYLLSGQFTASISVTGSSASCQLGDYIISDQIYVDPNPTYSGVIGASVWAERQNQSLLKIDSVSIMRIDAESSN